MLKMKLFTETLAIFILILIVGCASSSTLIATPEEKEFLNNLVSKKSFEINAQWARPMSSIGLNSLANAGLFPPGSTVNRVDISGSSSYLRINGDSVIAHLPYYGEQQLGGIYNPNDAGIQFEGVPKDFALETNTKNEGYTMKFSINNKTETFQVVAQLFPSRSSTFTISSTHRTSIWYDGRIAEIEKQ